MNDSRTVKSWKNAKVNLLFYFLTLLLTFFSRKIFLDCLGAEFLGLTGTLHGLLDFLNLAELGISTAIGYILYKPLFDNDRNKINEIVSVLGYLYRRVGLVLLGLGLLLACFLPFIFPSIAIQAGVVYTAYFSFLFSSLISYFINYKQTLLCADQRNYLITAWFQSATIVKTLIQMFFAYYTGNLYLWILIELLFGIIYSLILNWKVGRVYPWLKSDAGAGKALFRNHPEAVTYIRQIFAHKIGWFARFQSTTILVYAFTSLRTVAFYNNYSILFSKVVLLISNFLGSTSASIGNLIAEGNRKRIQEVYWELFGVRFLIVAVAMFGMYMLTSPFICLWLGKEYLLSNTILIIIVINLFLDQMRSVNDQFLFGFGLFNDTWAPLAEVAVNVTVALVGGSLYGLEGVLCGSIASNLLIAHIWKPYFLFTKGFNRKPRYYYSNLLVYILILTLCFYVSKLCIDGIASLDPYRNWSEWALYSLLSVSVFTVLLAGLLLIFTRGMRRFAKRFVYRYLDIKYLLTRKIWITIKGKLKGNLLKVFYVKWSNNFGDLLTPIILKYYCFTPVFAYPKKAQVAVVGTILELVKPDFDGYILGSGWPRDCDVVFPHAKVRGVRGYLTKNNLGINGTVAIGDPALIISDILPLGKNIKYRLGIIPHESETADCRLDKLKRAIGESLLIINPQRKNPRDVLKDIVSCQYIVSSSLHGLIVSDSYGIPNGRIIMNEIDNSGDYKFRDYYSSIGEEPRTWPITGEETLGQLIAFCRIPPPDKIAQAKEEIRDMFRRFRTEIKEP